MLAAQGIATGDIEVAVAGGMESMSNAPYLLPRVREGLRMGNSEIVDSMINDGCGARSNSGTWGMPARSSPTECGIARGRAGRVRGAQSSQGGGRGGAGASTPRSCRSTIPQKKGAPIRIDRDESIRAETTVETLAALKPAFRSEAR